MASRQTVVENSSVSWLPSCQTQVHHPAHYQNITGCPMTDGDLSEWSASVPRGKGWGNRQELAMPTPAQQHRRGVACLSRSASIEPHQGMKPTPRLFGSTHQRMLQTIQPANIAIPAVYGGRVGRRRVVSMLSRTPHPGTPFPTPPHAGKSRGIASRSPVRPGRAPYAAY